MEALNPTECHTTCSSHLLAEQFAQQLKVTSPITTTSLKPRANTNFCRAIANSSSSACWLNHRPLIQVALTKRIENLPFQQLAQTLGIGRRKTRVHHRKSVAMTMPAWLPALPCNHHRRNRRVSTVRSKVRQNSIKRLPDSRSSSPITLPCWHRNAISRAVTPLDRLRSAGTLASVNQRRRYRQ